MDRPERPDQPESESIFSSPDPIDEPTTPRPEPDQPQTTLDPLDVSTWGPPARPEVEAPSPLPGKPRVNAADGGGLSPRMLVGLGSAGAIALVLIGFIAFSVFGGEDEPLVAGGDASPTPTASPSAEATTAATPEPTASPEPTPKPTPAGPPVELAIGDWATVTVGELQVRAGAGENEASTYRLVRGAVMTVAEGPQVVNGATWYRIASLGGVTGWVTSGWVADPYLKTILNDPVLIRCGEVAKPVFDMVDGAPVAREVVRVGNFAVPSNKLDATTLAAIELARGIRAEVCVTAQVGSDGLPVLRSEPRVNACGHAVADGQAFWLRPAADQEADVSTQIKDPALVHPILLAGPAENRQSSNLRTLLTMMSHDGASGCVQASINIDSGDVQSYRSASIEQCSVVSEYNDLNLKLHPAAGGPMAWIKLPKDDSPRDAIPLERPIEVYVSTDVNPDGIWSWASSPFNYEREECA
jgi:hypothetical protein